MCARLWSFVLLVGLLSAGLCGCSPAPFSVLEPGEAGPDGALAHDSGRDSSLEASVLDSSLGDAGLSDSLSGDEPWTDHDADALAPACSGSRFSVRPAYPTAGQFVHISYFRTDHSSSWSCLDTSFTCVGHGWVGGYINCTASGCTGEMDFGPCAAGPATIRFSKHHINPGDCACDGDQQPCNGMSDDLVTVDGELVDECNFVVQ